MAPAVDAEKPRVLQTLSWLAKREKRRLQWLSDGQYAAYQIVATSPFRVAVMLCRFHPHGGQNLLFTVIYRR
jgi:hypothetical protein